MLTDRQDLTAYQADQLDRLRAVHPHAKQQGGMCVCFAVRQKATPTVWTELEALGLVKIRTTTEGVYVDLVEDDNAH